MDGWMGERESERCVCGMSYSSVSHTSPVFVLISALFLFWNVTQDTVAAQPRQITELFQTFFTRKKKKKKKAGDRNLLLR